MHHAFHRLEVRARPLGNHASKYLLNIEKNGERLLQALERSGRLSRVHIDRAAPSLADDFDQVAASGEDPTETLKLLGTFYGIQFLHQNARSLERLAVDVAEQPDRRLPYRLFLQRIEKEFFLLVSTYVRRVLRTIVSKSATGPYVICAVGTRGHQDDIDVVVLHKDGAGREALDHAVARLGGQMLKYASVLDHYLAGWVGGDGYCLTTEDLRKALDSGRPGFVVITELLRAEPLAGNRELVDHLNREVTDDFIYHEGQYNTRHELYLRGILGEIRSLLLRLPPRGAIHPKDDGLRLAIGLTSTYKTIEGLKATSVLDLLRQLRGRRPDLRGHLGPLRDSLVFLETFRQISQILIAEQDEIQLEGLAARQNLERVAAAMGYRRRVTGRIVDHLLVHYHEAVETIHKVAVPLMEDVAKHLAETSRFSRWTRKLRPEEAPPNMARDFAVTSRPFRRARFWDDVLEAMAAPDGQLIDAFATSFEAMPDKRRRQLAIEYGDWGRDAPYSLMTLLTLLAGRRGLRESVAWDEISDTFLDNLGSHPEDIRALARVFGSYPDRMNRFLLSLDADRLSRLRRALDAPTGNPEVTDACNRLRGLIQVHRNTSRYVKRVLARVTLRHPAVILSLGDDDTLKTLARGRLAEGERHTRTEDRKYLLGDFYDMEFLRIAMGTLRGVSRSDTCAAFTDLSTTYLSDVFDVCLRETEREAGRQMPDRDLLAIYLCGGHGRCRPYDEDYDLLVLLASDDEEARRLAEQAVARMNRQIAKRGVIAQYRLGERLGSFVSRIDQLEELLSGDDDDLFVDRCQVLGSRMVAGSPRVEEILVDRIIRPQIYERAEEFGRRVSREIRERREHREHIVRPDSRFVHIKEMPGGLREIDLCLTAIRARLNLRQPGGEDLVERLSLADPDRIDEYRGLGAASDFLVMLRSVYRVTVAASDVVEGEYLEVPARLLGYTHTAAGEPGDHLFREIDLRTQAAARAIERVLPEVLVETG
jgi:hypothetical protein